MGNACTNCSACKGDGGENGEILTVDHKVSKARELKMISHIVWTASHEPRTTCK